MAPRRRRSSRAEGPPRLVLRFAVCTAVGFAVAAAGILLIVRQVNTSQAERAATSTARFVTDSLLRNELAPDDFAGPVGGDRRTELDDLFRRRVLVDGMLLAKIYDASGTVTYSTEHALIGTRASDPAHVQEALAGAIRGDVTSTAAEGAAGADRKVLRTYAPVTFADSAPGGAVALFQDYAPIAQAANAAFFPIAGVFEVILVLLFVLLVPILRRVTLRVRHQLEEIEHRALHDELTGLPNRTLLRDRIGQAILAAKQDEHQAAVLLVDLDRFKEINDTLGHQTGDLLLQHLAARLTSTLREGETFARLGGDEFGILLPRTTPHGAASTAERIHEALEEPFTLRELPLAVGASIGIALYPEHGADVDSLVQRADVAMYLAKERHEGSAFYDPTQDTNDETRLALAGELRRAIERRELILYYQPKANVTTGYVTGVEALVRWDHPERGLLPPGEFIPLAERTSLIKPLSRYVLAAALRQCREWADLGIDLHVAVNLTMHDLLDLELPEQIAGLLAETGVRPSRLELEITEGTIMADPFRVRQVLTELSEMGLRLSIDDFGTGYSSLAYLRRLPVDTIKIDRSFVMGMSTEVGDATIVRSTIDLGRNLGLEVVAEGVETAEAWETLRAYGCSLAQGYYISRPLPPEALTAKLAASLPSATAAEPAGVS